MHHITASEFLHRIADLIAGDSHEKRPCKDCGAMITLGVRCIKCATILSRTQNTNQRRAARARARTAKLQAKDGTQKEAVAS